MGEKKPYAAPPIMLASMPTGGHKSKGTAIHIQRTSLRTGPNFFVLPYKIRNKKKKNIKTKTKKQTCYGGIREYAAIGKKCTLGCKGMSRNSVRATDPKLLQSFQKS